MADIVEILYGLANCGFVCICSYYLQRNVPLMAAYIKMEDVSISVESSLI